MLEFILADQLVDLPPQVEASSGQEWQFQISIVTAHIGRSTGRSTPQSSIDALNTVTPNLADLPADLPPHNSAMHHEMYITGCIWQPLWILQEKVGICFYFSIVR